MTATTHSTALATIQPSFTDAERLALAGFLAGYRGLTRDAYTLDLRQFSGWCRARSLSLFSVRRADIETFARELEALGCSATRWLGTSASRWVGMTGDGKGPADGVGGARWCSGCRGGGRVVVVSRSRG